MIFILFLIFVTTANALNCSNGLSYGYTITTTTIPANLSQFLSIVGSFYNDTWYNYPVNSTIGPDNQVNSTRIITDATDTLIFHETLIVYQLNQTFFRQTWRGPGDAIQTDNFGTFILGSYIESLSGENACQGSGTLINFSIEFCTTNLSTAASVLTQGHVDGIQQVRNLLGIENFTTCTSIAYYHKSSHFTIGLLFVLPGFFINQ